MSGVVGVGGVVWCIRWRGCGCGVTLTSWCSGYGGVLGGVMGGGEVGEVGPSQATMTSNTCICRCRPHPAR